MLWAAGTHLGSLAGGDLAARCAEGRLDPMGRAVSRAARKRALTARSSSRWAGAITRTSEDQWSLAERNLRAARASLQARVRRIEARLAIAAGGRPGRTRGYATPSERHGKVLRLHELLEGPPGPGGAAAGGGDSAGGAGRPGAAAQAGQPRRSRAHRGAVAGGLGSQRGCS